MIFSNFYPVPEFPFNILPFIFGGILLVGLLWYWYLEAHQPGGGQAGRHHPDRCRMPSSSVSSTRASSMCWSTATSTPDADGDPEARRDKEPVAP